MEKKTNVPITHIRPLSGDSAPLGVINTVEPRGVNESHSREGGGPVRKDTSPFKKKIQKTRGRETRTGEVKDPSPSMAHGEPCTRRAF